MALTWVSFVDGYAGHQQLVIKSIEESHGTVPEIAALGKEASRSSSTGEIPRSRGRWGAAGGKIMVGRPRLTVAA